MEKIMNVENEWDQMVEADMVEGPVEGVTDEEVMEAMNKMRISRQRGVVVRSVVFTTTMIARLMVHLPT